MSGLLPARQNLLKPTSHLVSGIKNPLPTSASERHYAQNVTHQLRVGERFCQGLLQYCTYKGNMCEALVSQNISLLPLFRIVTSFLLD